MLALWLVAAGALALTCAVLAVRTVLGRRTAFPLARSSALVRAARSSVLLWAGLAGTLIVLALVFAGSGRSAQPGSSVLPPGANAIIVLDLSSSTGAYSYPITRILRALTRDGRRHLGLVVFSDTAYEALPPATPVEGLRGWLDAFSLGGRERYPWTDSFSGGTAISTGLALALTIIHREHIRQPHVVLVSDLVDSDPDVGRLTAINVAYQNEDVDLRVVKVQDELQGTSEIVGRQRENAGFLTGSASVTVQANHYAEASQPARTARLLALLLGLVALLAAGYELAFHPLTWRHA